VTLPDRVELLEVALSAVTEAVLAVDSQQLIAYLNPAAEAMTGWRRGESMGHPLRDILCILDEESGATVDDPLASGRTRSGLVNRHGHRTEIEFQATPLNDSDGHYVGAVLVCRQRRQDMEIALQTSNESLLANADALFEEKERAQVTLNSIGDAVVTTNFSGRVNYLNSVAEKLTGWRQSEASGQAVDDIFTIVDCETRETIPCPTARAIIEDRRVSLSTGCLLRRQDFSEVAVEVSAAPIHDRIGGVIGAVMVAQDVTAARELSSKLARLAHHDSLTDLPNRALFTERLGKAVAHAREHGCYAALLYVDLDRFKRVNDSLGHAIGDKLLQAAARRLQGCVRSTDTVSRQGGDEFVVLLTALANITDASTCAENILRALQSTYRIDDHELMLTASIGIAVFPDDAEEGEALLRCADVAMYQAKYNGRNNYRLFQPGSTIDPRE